MGPAIALKWGDPPPSSYWHWDFGALVRPGWLEKGTKGDFGDAVGAVTHLAAPEGYENTASGGLGSLGVTGIP